MNICGNITSVSIMTVRNDVSLYHYCHAFITHLLFITVRHLLLTCSVIQLRVFMIPTYVSNIPQETCIFSHIHLIERFISLTRETSINTSFPNDATCHIIGKERINVHFLFCESNKTFNLEL